MGILYQGRWRRVCTVCPTGQESIACSGVADTTRNSFQTVSVSTPFAVRRCCRGAAGQERGLGPSGGCTFTTGCTSLFRNARTEQATSTPWRTWRRGWWPYAWTRPGRPGLGGSVSCSRRCNGRTCRRGRLGPGRVAAWTRVDATYPSGACATYFSSAGERGQEASALGQVEQLVALI
jgi:hypothetical protein